MTSRWKDYRRGGATRQQVITLAVKEFNRHFLLQVLLKGFHSIRQHALLARVTRQAT